MLVNKYGAIERHGHKLSERTPMNANMISNSKQFSESFRAEISGYRREPLDNYI
jgi:hypothetical protein